MSVAIRKHARDFAAIAFLLVAGILVSYVIVQQQRLRIPILEQRPFELKADFQTAQAVVPGQGQTIRVAGVQVGDVEDVKLVDGKAEVTFGINRDYLPIYKDATILMRPTTGLKDMFFSLDPGTRSAGEISEGGTIPLENTAPDVNLDEILSNLDGDTQSYLRILLVGAGKGLQGRGKDLGKVLGTLGPINHDFKRLNKEVAQRKENLRRLVTNFNQLTGAVGRADDDLKRLVTSSATSLGAIAEQDPSVRRAVQLLPGTLAQSKVALQHVASFAAELGPTVNDLQPFAQNLDEVNSSTLNLANQVTGPVKNEIRPVRQGGPQADPRPDEGGEAARQGDAAADDGRRRDQPPRQHGGVQPERRGAGRRPGPRRGLPVLGRLARPQRQLGLLDRRRERLRAPHLPDDGLRRGAGAARLEPAGAPRHRSRRPLRSRRTLQWRVLR